MKKSTSPVLHVEPEFLAAIESVLQEDETLPGVVEQSIELGIARRRYRQVFVTRGLASAAGE